MTRNSSKRLARQGGAALTSAGLRFTYLYLENWRNFSRVEIDLQRRVFLVGPNASGKSNFLDVFRFLHDLAAVGGGLQAAVARKPRGKVSDLRSLAARNPSDIVIRVRVGDDSNPKLWDYELRITQDKKGRPKVNRERVISGDQEIFTRPREVDMSDPERLTQTFLEQVNANVRFRALAEFFGSVRYLHIVPQLVREPERTVDRSGDPYGGGFLEQVAQTSEKTRKARLSRIRSALRLAVPQLQKLELWRDDRGMPHLRGKYEHWRPQGAWQTENHLSDGTLRLLGLLWAVLDSGGPLLLEEPELSLHPEVVRSLPQMFARTQRHSGRQIILSTHSPDLLTDEGIAQDEVLLLKPAKEGTVVRRAQDIDDIADLLMGGSNLADIVMPLTRPDQADQLTLFPD
ncbi:MAG: AAA family ATPase [Acidobacteria bacterium]|nr:AAA family ATPase [Acidobacteriota bacterium]